MKSGQFVSITLREVTILQEKTLPQERASKPCERETLEKCSKALALRHDYCGFCFPPLPCCVLCLLGFKEGFCPSRFTSFSILYLEVRFKISGPNILDISNCIPYQIINRYFQIFYQYPTRVFKKPAARPEPQFRPSPARRAGPPVGPPLKKIYI